MSVYEDLRRNLRQQPAANPSITRSVDARYGPPPAKVPASQYNRPSGSWYNPALERSIQNPVAEPFRTRTFDGLPTGGRSWRGRTPGAYGNTRVARPLPVNMENLRRRLPAVPRSPGVNPRWPRWARIPPRMRLPGLIGVGGAGLTLLRPSPIDLLFGVIPDAMEAARPWVWEQLGIKDPNAPAGGGSGGIQLPNGGNLVWTLNGAAVAGVYNSRSPFSWKEESPAIHRAPGRSWDGTPMVGSKRAVIYSPTGSEIVAGGTYPIDNNPPYVLQYQEYRADGSLGPLINPADIAQTSPGATTANPLSPTMGIQAGTPPFSGMPAASRGQRPATDPRGWRPDLAQIPQTAPQPRVQTQAEPEPDQAATNCRFTPANQAERDALNDKIRDLNEEIRRILRENQGLREELAAANQATFFQVPYVVENANGQRVKQFYPITLKGLVDTTSEASLSNQTADWAMAKADRSERIYQILGGDSTWGSQPTPQAQVNPDAQLRAQPVIDEAGLGRMLDIRNLPQLFTATQAATYQRQGLQQFPITAQVPALTNNGLLPDREVAQTFNTATDVQMTTSNRGWAIVKGVNEVIIKTKQTIEWLRIDRLLNLLNFATTLHNALMLSNALSQTLMGIIDNILATFGFALKDATGNTIGVGDLVGGTIENVIKAAIGADNYTKLKKEWAKANRIYQAGMNIIYSVQSIGYSILGALEIVGKWVAWIGNALKRFGALTEKAYPWMNPTPNFQNPIFTKIEAAQEFAEALEVVTAESRSVTETVTELGNQKKALDKELEEGKDTRNLPDNKEQKENQDKARTVSQAPIIPKFDLVRPEPEDR